MSDVSVQIAMGEAVMQPRHVSGAAELDRAEDHGLAVSMTSWRDTGPFALFVTHPGDDSAGDGGNGYFAGTVIDDSRAVFEPVNVADAGAHAEADAQQTNIAYFDQAAIQIAGIGGDGGDENAALGGSTASFGPSGFDANATAASTAGNGGDGQFSGTVVAAPVAIYAPLNVAAAGSHGGAVADQSNTVEFLQDATQIAGVGGNGGNGNAAMGSDAFGLGASHGAHSGSIGSDAITAGAASAGDGGNGQFSGALVDAPVVIYDPINIAVAGPHGTAVADQSNTVAFLQDASQIAGVGGTGGSGNTAAGGDIFASASDQGTHTASSGSGMMATGGSGAGNGGDGHFSGVLVDAPVVIYDPINIAVAGPHGTAVADQTNTVEFLQDATQIAGVGGNGGSGNAAAGGEAPGFGTGQGSNSIGSEVITTGGASSGNGGAGHFAGALVDTPVVIYDPINIAVAGPNGTAVADQTNTVEFLQDATQIAGVGGHGGSGNTAIGGEALGFATGDGSNSIGSSGSASSGNGGEGHFAGALVNAPVVIYDPINIAVAGVNSSAHADQTNTVDFDQAAIQIAGVGGHGGSGNAAFGGIAGTFSSESGLIGSDVIATGGNSAGNGGNGHFDGSVIDVDVAIYAPVNIAIAGYNSTAEAAQGNNVLFDQSAIQIAGLGGDGGNANLALTLHAVAEHHLLDHVL